MIVTIFFKRQMKGGKMKKNLIFGISLGLVVLMASGVFAGLFGLTGKAGDEQSSVGFKLYEGDTEMIQFQKAEFILGVLSVDEVEGVLNVNGKSYTFLEGASKKIENVYFTANSFGRNWFGKNYFVLEIASEGVSQGDEKPVEECVDSDGGLNYYEKGSAVGFGDEEIESCTLSSWNEERDWWEYKNVLSCPSETNKNSYSTNNPNGSKEDKCLIRETYCDPNDNHPTFAEYHYCAFGCVDGACIEDGRMRIDDEEVTYEGVLAMLNSCVLISPNGEENLGNLTTGNKACENYNLKYFKNSHCLFSETLLGEEEFIITELVPCDIQLDNTRLAHIFCCSAP